MKKLISILALCLAVVLSVAACKGTEAAIQDAAPVEEAQPTPAAEDPLAALESQPISVNNDSCVLGELETFHPAVEADIAAGESIVGSEEEQLQQERISGGAVGGVVSQNLEPLTGITDYSEGEYVTRYGIE